MIPTPLKEGIDSLEALEEVEILDRHWKDGSDSEYILRVKIERDVDCSEARLPIETNWHLVIDSDYPAGDITIYPSKKGGVKRTFAHQRQNREGSQSDSWRTGNICVGRYESRVGRSADREPFTPEKRLLWYLERAVRWVEDATKGELRKEGEFYEIPDFDSPNNGPRFVFNETYDSFERWDPHKGSWGRVTLAELERPPNRILIKKFVDKDGRELYHPSWGDYVSGSIGEEISSAWLLLNEPPFREPWAAPETWNGLDSFLNGIPEGIYKLIATVSDDLPEAENRYLLVGFPIPRKIGEEPCLVHWQPILIPHIQSPTERNGGFRDTDVNRYRETKAALETKEVCWLAAENWAGEQLSRRGGVSKKLANSKTLLIGAGALGSIIAENLVRAGIQNLTIVDGDDFEIGNIARHTLTLEDIGKPKASAVAERLRSLSPHAEIDAIDSSFPPGYDYRDQLHDADLVIDCTGENSVLEHLKGYAWLDTVRFCSVSMGRRGNRLFVFQAYDNIFPGRRFSNEIEGWLQKEDLERTERDIIVERIGCWHPASVIPINKIATWGGVVPDLLERMMHFSRNSFELTVLERDGNAISEVEEPFTGSIRWSATETSREIQLLRNCGERMRDLCIEAQEIETGGILVGKYTEDGSNALVAIADEPAPDSVQTSTTLWRGSEGVNEWLAKQRELKGVRYLGEWHYHPGGRPKPSKTDKDTLREIARNDDYACSEPIMIILGGDVDSGFSRGVYAFHDEKDIEKFEQSS